MSWISRFRVRRAVAHVRQGGIIAYPTEAVFGLGCDPMNRQAVEWIGHLKGRPQQKSFILIAASYSQIEPLLPPLSLESINKLMESWPGPVTWIVPAACSVPVWLTAADHTIALRVSDHPVVRALCLEYGGPLISTSANPSGYPPARDALKVRCYFKDTDVHILPGPLGNEKKPSAIYELLSGKRLR